MAAASLPPAWSRHARHTAAALATSEGSRHFCPQGPYNITLVHHFSDNLKHFLWDELGVLGFTWVSLGSQPVQWQNGSGCISK